jgi:hypothetical protein
MANESAYVWTTGYGARWWRKASVAVSGLLSEDGVILDHGGDFGISREQERFLLGLRLLGWRVGPSNRTGFNDRRYTRGGLIR